MKKRKKDPLREGRIYNKAIVDAYGPEERAMGGITTWKATCGFHLRPDASLPRSFRQAIGLEVRRIAIKDGEMANQPLCVLATAREGPSTVDGEPASGLHGLAGWSKC